MLELIQNIFILPLILASAITLAIYGYFKATKQTDEYTKRDYVRYFMVIYISGVGLLYLYQKLNNGGSIGGVGDAIQAGGSGIAQILTEEIADCAENLVPAAASSSASLLGMATNIMERFNTGRPTF